MVRSGVHWVRCLAVVAAILSMAFSALGNPVATAAQTTDTENESGVSGNSYTSPSFGYSFEWDRSWDVTNETTEDDYNLLQLEDQASLLMIEGYGFSSDPEECVQSILDQIATVEGFSDFDTGTIDADDETGNVELTFILTFEDESGDEVAADYSGYLECRVINDGDATLTISHYGVTDSWDDESDAREDVLDTIETDGQAPANDDTDDATDDEPEVNAPGTDDEGDTDSLMTEVQGDGDLPSNSDELLLLFESSINDIDIFWEREYPLLTGGQQYVPPTEFIPFVGTIDTPCGPASSFEQGAGGSGPFFCPPNNTIYIDMGFANYQFDSVADVPFLIPVVLAHEVGHHVQNILGMDICYSTPCLDPNQLTSQEIEYMADCHAGAWSRDAELRGRLGEGDIEANIVQYAVLLGGGTEGADPGGHGRGAERVWWFLNGYLEGSAKCYETSEVTKEWAQTGPPNARTANAETTPEAGDPTETTEAGEPTATPETTEPNGDLAQMNDVVEIAQGTLEATQTQLETAIENREADGAFAIVFVTVNPADGQDGPFEYESWTLVDADGTAYELDARATDILLSSAYEDGMDEVLESGSGYKIALVFDVPEDASGLILTNDTEGVQIQLDI